MTLVMDGTVGRGGQPCSHGCISRGGAVEEPYMRRSMHPGTAYPEHRSVAARRGQAACLPARGTSHRGRLGDGGRDGEAQGKASGRRPEADGREAGAGQGKAPTGLEGKTGMAHRTPSPRQGVWRCEQRRTRRDRPYDEPALDRGGAGAE